jgi:hypothetical protein
MVNGMKLVSSISVFDWIFLIRFHIGGGKTVKLKVRTYSSTIVSPSKPYFECD